MASPWVAGVKIAGKKLRKTRNEFRRVETLLKDSFSMGSWNKDRRKKRNDTRITR